MKEKVRLKSYTKGIKIVIDEDAGMEDILAEIAEKFKDSEKFFGKAKLAVTFEGRENTIEEENAILDKIKETSSVNIVCVVSSKTDDSFERAIDSIEQILSEDTAQFYRGDLAAKTVLETEQSIIILGNVKKGSSIVSKKDIIILGSQNSRRKSDGDIYKTFKPGKKIG